MHTNLMIKKEEKHLMCDVFVMLGSATKREHNRISVLQINQDFKR